MGKPQAVNGESPHQPDVFERCEAQADELALLASNILEAALHYSDSRKNRLFGGMRSAAIDLQTYRTQFTAMVASIERVIEGGM